MADTATVTLDRDEYEQLTRAADIGHALIDWHRRAVAADDSHAISAAADWARVAAEPTWAELQARRGDTAARSDHNPLDELFPTPRPLTASEQRRASLLLDAALGALHTHDAEEVAA